MISTKIAQRLRIYRLGKTITSTIEVPAHIIDDVIDVLESHDARIADLLRYNSEQVVKRRVLKARLNVALAALQSAREWFRDYARQHRAKGTEDAQYKAHTNDHRADEMDRAMTVEIHPEDYGRP